MTLQSLKIHWPSSIVARTAVAEFSGGLLDPKTLANHDSNGEGPVKCRLGRKVFYQVDDLVSWMESRLEVTEG